MRQQQGQNAFLNPNPVKLGFLASKTGSHYVNFDIKVKDFGCGMSKANLSKLFIDFNKMEESQSLNKQGVGLGLSICKNLIELMAGAVTVESELNVGTTFTINFKTMCIYANGDDTNPKQ